MYAVIIETAAPDGAKKSGDKKAHYFGDIHMAQKFALNNVNNCTNAAIFEEIGRVYDGKVIISNKFMRANKPIPEDDDGKNSN